MKITLWLGIAVALVASFYVGAYVEQQQARQTVISRCEMPSGRQVIEMGTGIFSYSHEAVATLETRVRLSENQELYVIGINDAREMGVEELYTDLQSLPGVEKVMMFSPWRIHLEKTEAFSWAEVEPILEEIAARHQII